jgi:putative tryptophan/tyrosine transport system substrate-binding protein
MRRRDFITLLGGTVATWPFAARAQQGGGMRRIGVLMDFAADEPEGQVRLAALLQGLGELGWIADRNVRIDQRWGATDVDRVRRYAVELVGLTPDVILGGGATAVRSLQQATGTVPIVFAGVTDPVGGGLVASLARPGGNSTGLLTASSKARSPPTCRCRRRPDMSCCLTSRPPRHSASTSRLPCSRARTR